jgi:hypothetical protein
VIDVSDVYAPDEIERLHRAYGWSNYVGSAAFGRRMQSEVEQFAEFQSHNYAARDTWATVSFQDWQRHLKYAGQMLHWDAFVALRDKALEGKK